MLGITPITCPRHVIQLTFGLYIQSVIVCSVNPKEKYKLKMAGPVIPFGHQIRDKYFTGFSKGVVNLNHGAFGATTNELFEAKTEVTKKTMQFPDKFYRFTLLEESKRCRALVAEKVHCDVEDLVLVTNATTAVNAVLRSYAFKKDNVIICFSTIYGSCYNTLLFLQEYIGIKLVKIEITYPISNDEIIEKLTKKMSELDHPPTMVFMDAITSTPSALFPWKKIVEICRQRNIISFVDGAHYIGILPLDLRSTRPDFFTSNLHKWYFVPNSCGFLYVDKKFHTKVHSLPISAVYTSKTASEINTANLVSSQFDDKTKTLLSDQFAYVSTTDYSSMLTIPAAIKFRDEVCGGDENIRAYNDKLLKEAVAVILKKWPKSELLTGGKDNIDTTMFNIKLPEFQDLSNENMIKVAIFLNDYLTKVKKTFVPIFIYDGGLWSRWSVQIYLELSDFEWGAESISEAISEAKKKLLLVSTRL